MKTTLPRLYLAVLLLLPVSAFAQTYTATLLGSNEVGGGDVDGTGHATIVFNGNLVTYTITVANIVMPPIGQHIHSGAAGVNGPVEIALTGTWTSGTLSGSVTADPADVAAIHANPAGFYVNVHTTDFPGGAVRGQMVFQSASTSIPTASTGILLLMAGVLALAGALALRRL